MGLIDRPSARKRHDKPTPMVGGLAVFLGLAAAISVAAPLDHVSPFLTAAALFVLVGVVDDRLEISGPFRSLIQAAIVTGFLFTTSVRVADLGLGTEIPAHPGLTTLGYFFTVVALIGLVNAFNLIDGLDGLSSGLAIIALSGVGAAATLAGRPEYGLSVVVMIAPVLVFWAANTGLLGAGLRTFLGDAGATLLGFLVGVTLIQSSQPPVAVIEPVFVVWCVAVPVIDTLQVMYNRLRGGRSIFDSDRLHMHYRLVDAGFSTRQSVTVILAGNAAVVGLGLALTTLSPTLSLVVFVALGAAYANWNAIRIQAARVMPGKYSRRRFDTL